MHLLVRSYRSLRQLREVRDEKSIMPEVITGLYLLIIAVMGIAKGHEGIKGYTERRHKAPDTQVYAVLEYNKKSRFIAMVNIKLRLTGFLIRYHVDIIDIIINIM